MRHPAGRLLPQPGLARGASGFTLLEIMAALAILGVVLSVGIPSMSDWVYRSKVAGAAQFYAEGFALARSQALSHNSASRLVLTENAANGQFDWQVDICFPRPAQPCNENSDNWSTAAAAAANDPQGETGFTSVLRPAAALPAAAELTPAVTPDDARAVYFTPLGWVNRTFAPGVERIDLTPAPGRADAAPASAIVLTLAGIATRCRPGAAAGDPYRCPP